MGGMLNLRRPRSWLGASAVVGLVAFVASTSGAADGQPATWPTSPPQLKQGEIVIKPTGRTRVVRAVQPAAPLARAPAEGEDDEYTPRRRAVTIGYFVRDPGETGWGPQIHWAPYAYPSYAYGSCGTGYTGWGYPGVLFGGSGCYGGIRDVGFHPTGPRHGGLGHGGQRYAPRSAAWRR